MTGSVPDTKELITVGRVKESRDIREDFEKCIEEIDRQLNKFDKNEILKLGIDKDRILGEESGLTML